MEAIIYGKYGSPISWNSRTSKTQSVAQMSWVHIQAASINLQESQARQSDIIH